MKRVLPTEIDETQQPPLKRRRYVLPPKKNNPGYLSGLFSRAKQWSNSFYSYWFGIPNPTSATQSTTAHTPTLKEPQQPIAQNQPSFVITASDFEKEQNITINLEKTSPGPDLLPNPTADLKTLAPTATTTPAPISESTPVPISASTSAPIPVSTPAPIPVSTPAPILASMPAPNLTLSENKTEPEDLPDVIITKVILPSFKQHTNNIDSESWIKKLKQVEGLNEEDAKQLINNQRLGSGILNRFFEMLPEKFPNTFSIDSSLITLSNLFDRIKNRSMLLRDLKDNLNSTKTILWPICSGEPNNPQPMDHWYLMIFDKTSSGRYNIYFLDGFNSPQARYLKEAKALLTALYPNTPIDELINETTCVRVNKQNNGTDCGVVACYWALEYLKGYDFKTQPSENAFDYGRAFRIPMAKMLTEDKPDNKKGLKQKS
ncbi:MAG: hypothetical protein JSS07_11335 [Proteobacteria bacterium]|nr:hypothetical protein [Pseudomonadota bacterium]